MGAQQLAAPRADNEALLDALDRLRHTGPEFGGFLANHGPMAAEAMIQLGGEDAVGRWVDTYVGRLDAAPVPIAAITDQDWSEHLGNSRRFADWTAYLRRLAAEMAWPDLLATWWPRLLPGMAASATHGVIRTAHAVRSLREAGEAPDPLLVDELAQGLAFWAARFQPLLGDPRLSGRLDAVTAVRQLPRLPASEEADGPGIGGRLRVLHKVSELPSALDQWSAPATTDDALDELIGAAARVLAARPDAPIAFCHTVTAPAAVRLVLPVLQVPLHRPSVAASWQTVGAIIAAYASPPNPAEAAAVDADADQLLTRLTECAVQHDDEHVIKLTEAALREYARTQDTTLLVAADRFRERVSAGT